MSIFIGDLDPVKRRRVHLASKRVPDVLFHIPFHRDLDGSIPVL
jgi:hypothetical protein